MRRKIKNRLIRGFLVSCSFSLGVFHILLATVLLLDTIQIVAVDLMMAMVLIFSFYPAAKFSPRDRLSVSDAVLVLASVLGGLYTLYNHEGYMYRLGQPSASDIAMGAVAIVLVLEAARRTTGFALPLITTVAILYCFFGNYAPEMFIIKPLSVKRVVYHLFCGLQGIYGTVLIVASTIIFLFVIFAAFLRGSAVGDFFLDFSYSLVGRMRGGPAKLAVLASGLMGMISGAGAANVVATGSVTIPLMKKYGYRPHVAGAVEAAASTGGQLMPPIMGATAFVITQFTGVPYSTICFVSILPSLLYILSVMTYVHFEALKYDLQPADTGQVPNLKRILSKRGHLVLPVVLLTAMILSDYSLSRSAMVSTAVLILVSSLRKATRMRIKDIVSCISNGSLDMLMLISACAAAGIILGVVSLTGLGLRLSSIFISAAGGSLFFMICLVGLVSVIFGMGLPVLASYIVLATLAGPALEELGVPMLTAHLVIFWFSVDANVTPPVAIAAYVAAGIARSKILATSFEAWKAAKGLYVMPFLMVYGPLLSGNLLLKLEVSFMTLLAFVALTAANKGYLFTKIYRVERIFLLASGILLLLPGNKGYLPMTHLAGFLLLAGVAYTGRKQWRKTGKAPVPGKH